MDYFQVNDSISSGSRNYHYVLTNAAHRVPTTAYSIPYVVYTFFISAFYARAALPDHPRTSLSLLTCAV